MKKAIVAILGLMLITACSKGVTKDKYVDVMVDMGCNLAINPMQIQEMLKKHGVTEKSLDEFRKNADQKEMVAISMEIATKVAACYGAATAE